MSGANMGARLAQGPRSRLCSGKLLIWDTLIHVFFFLSGLSSGPPSLGTASTVPYPSQPHPRRWTQPGTGSELVLDWPGSLEWGVGGSLSREWGGIGNVLDWGIVLLPGDFKRKFHHVMSVPHQMQLCNHPTRNRSEMRILSIRAGPRCVNVLPYTLHE